MELLKKVSEEELEKIERNYWKTQLKRMLKDWRLYVMLIPLIFVFFCWKYLPLQGLLIGFKNFTQSAGIGDSQFVGLHWFEKLMFGDASVQFWRAFKNTFVISFYGLVFGFPFPIILALLFSEIKSDIYRSVVQIFCYLPKFVSIVVITTITICILRPSTDFNEAGPLAQLMYSLNIVPEFINNNGVNEPNSILKNPEYFRALYQITGIWETGGYSSIVYFAAIIGISPTSYEAVRIDGANKMAQIKYVTFPSIASTLTIMLIMQIGHLLTVGYEKVLLLTNNGQSPNASAGEVITAYVYRIAMTGAKANPSMGSAADLFNAIIAMLLVLGSNAIARRVSSTSLY